MAQPKVSSGAGVQAQRSPWSGAPGAGGLLQAVDIPSGPTAEVLAEQALQRWMDARLVAALLAVNPVGLGGAQVMAAPGPVRDEWLRTLTQACPSPSSLKRMPQHADEARLLGGLDLAATLQSSRPVLQAGLLSELDGGLLLCPMAERLPRRVVAFLCQALDRQHMRVERDGLGLDVSTRLAVVALDEAVPDGDDPGIEPALCERLAFVLDLHRQDWRSCGLSPLSAPSESAWEKDEMDDITQARDRLDRVLVSDEMVTALVQAAQALGVESVRAPWWAVQATRTLAALRGLDAPGAQEVRDAARLVLGPRATRVPAPPQPEVPEEAAAPPQEQASAAEQQAAEPPPASQPEAQNEPSQGKPEQADEAQDLSIEAVQAALPAGLLATLAQRNGLTARTRKSGEASSRAGDRQRAGAQGRPAGTRPGQPEAGQRLSLIDTLRQAAPWQRIRKSQRQVSPAVVVHREYLRVIRREPRRPTTTVFVVDASGSNALNRLAEAKGAVETLLADCYVRRDRVAVIGFRGQTSETLLPPTRSLVRAKRSLAGLPGGGGTPMAQALTDSRLMCETLQRRGDTVSLVLLTDGKANISLEGKPGRERAHADAVTAARQLFVCGVACLLIDTSPKPQAQARELALAMGARYIPLPQAQAGEIGRIVRNTRPI